MAKRRSIEDLERAAKVAEERARRYRQQMKERTRADDARLNADILSAVEDWRQSYPNPLERKELPGRFRQWAQQNREKHAANR